MIMAVLIATLYDGSMETSFSVAAAAVSSGYEKLSTTRPTWRLEILAPPLSSSVPMPDSYKEIAQIS